MGMIDSDKLHIELLNMEFPVYDQDPILDAMDDCIVDAVPVVRCKDCKYYEVDAGLVGGVACLQHGHKWTIPKPDDFCSYAEKKA